MGRDRWAEAATVPVPVGVANLLPDPRAQPGTDRTVMPAVGSAADVSLRRCYEVLAGTPCLDPL